MSHTAADMRTLYVGSLHNTHAIEMQALQMMERQVERYEHYPEMTAILQRHIAETHEQRNRLERALASLDEGPSTLKESFLGMVGNAMALGHTPASDEVLKNLFVSFAFENFEIAAYRSLIVIAEDTGHREHIDLFRQSLSEEEMAARSVDGQIEMVTKRFMTLTRAGENASR